MNSRKSTSSIPESWFSFNPSSISCLISWGGLTINILSIIAGVIPFITTDCVGLLSSEETIVAAYAWSNVTSPAWLLTIIIPEGSPYSSGSSIIKCEGCGEKYIAVARMQLEVESLKVIDEVILDRKLGVYVSKRTGKAVKPWARR